MTFNDFKDGEPAGSPYTHMNFDDGFRQVTHIKHNKSLFKREETLFIWHFFSLLPFFGLKKSSNWLILVPQRKQNDALLHEKLKFRNDLRGIIVPYV